MKITVKLFATLGQYLPAGAERHQVEIEVPDGTTPAAVIERLHVPPRMAHLVMIDGVFVPPEERPYRRLHEREQLAIFPPVAGG
jgi:sulfur carrier protein ThiS